MELTSQLTEVKMGFDDDFSCMDVATDLHKHKDNHDETIPRIIPAPTDPLRNPISSDSYINSLEKKLKKIKGKQTDNIRGKDMISSLVTAKQEHLTRMIDSDQQEAFQEGEYCNNNSLTFTIQRKVNPDKQALNPQELYPLMNDDVLAKLTEANNEDSEVKESDMT